MGIAERKAREKKQRREAIIDAAEKVYIRNGYRAMTMEIIAEEGADALYKGDLGHAMAKEITTNHGYVAFEELCRYEARVRKPITLHSRGFQMAVNPPPAIGGAMVGSMIRMFVMSDSEKVLAIVCLLSKSHVFTASRGSQRQLGTRSGGSNPGKRVAEKVSA